jgi:hypothetical protein
LNQVNFMGVLHSRFGGFVIVVQSITTLRQGSAGAQWPRSPGGVRTVAITSLKRGDRDAAGLMSSTGDATWATPSAVFMEARLRFPSITLMAADKDAFEGGGMRLIIARGAAGAPTGVTIATGRVRGLAFQKIA